MYRMLKLLKKL